MKRGYVWYTLGMSIMIFFIVFSIDVFKSSLTPYVSFAEAKTLHNSSIQIRGVILSDSIHEKGKTITFSLCDDNEEQVGVVYHGVRPDGFDKASSIVAIGKYQDGQFNAEKILVKCPSKYQGLQGGSSKL